MKLTASKYRWVLLLALILLFVGSASGFYYINKQLMSFNSETAKLSASAEDATNQLGELNKAIDYINTHQLAEDRAKSITADSAQYEYQDVLIKNIRDLASSSNLFVEKIEFLDSEAAGAATAAPATPGAAIAPADSVAGFDTKTARVQFRSEISKDPYYQQILDLMYKIENNDLKMHIDQLELSSTSVNSRNVNITDLTISVYVKQSGGAPSGQETTTP